MPRPGHAHADAEAEDVADVTGGEARDSDAEFEQDAALPGGDGQTEENEAEHLEWHYRPKYSVMSDELGDIVHRRGDAEKHIKNKHNTGKKDISVWKLPEDLDMTHFRQGLNAVENQLSWSMSSSMRSMCSTGFVVRTCT